MSKYLDDRMFVSCIAKVRNQTVEDKHSKVIGITFDNIDNTTFYTNTGIVYSGQHTISIFYKLDDKKYSEFEEKVFDNTYAVLTFKNQIGYPPFRSDMFDSKDETITYLKNIAGQTPMVSLEGKSLNSIISFEEYKEYLKRNNLDEIKF